MDRVQGRLDTTPSTASVSSLAQHVSRFGSEKMAMSKPVFDCPSRRPAFWEGAKLALVATLFPDR